MELKTYIHFHLGCIVTTANGEEYSQYFLRGIEKGDNYICLLEDIELFISQPIHISLIKPMLRKLNSITAEENIEYNKLSRNNESSIKIIEDIAHFPEQFFYLLSKHFDLFGLIENKLAIEL